MKAIADAKLDELEDATMLSVKQLKAYFAYQGDNPVFFKKARLATAMISAYGRLRASETNRMAVELAMKKSR